MCHYGVIKTFDFQYYKLLHPFHKENQVGFRVGPLHVLQLKRRGSDFRMYLGIVLESLLNVLL